MHRSERNGDRLIVADAITEADLLALGTLARSHRLVTGGSGIAMGLPGNFGIRPGEDGDKSFATVSGLAIVLSGSCSSATRRQIDAYRNGHPSLRLDAADVLETDGATQRGLDFIAANREAAPLIYSTAESAEVYLPQPGGFRPSNWRICPSSSAGQWGPRAGCSSASHQKPRPAVAGLGARRGRSVHLPLRLTSSRSSPRRQWKPA